LSDELNRHAFEVACENARRTEAFHTNAITALYPPISRKELQDRNEANSKPMESSKGLAQKGVRASRDNELRNVRVGMESQFCPQAQTSIHNDRTGIATSGVTLLRRP